MTQHDRLIALLAQLVADGQITEEQAAGVLLTWREIADLDTILPLPLAEAIQEEPTDDAAILAILLAVLGARAAGARRSADILARLAPQYRRPVVDMIQDYHAAAAAELAEELTDGRISLSQWQRRIRTLNQQTTRTLAQMGAGLRVGQLEERIAGAQLTQAAYLQRFAEQIAAGQIAARFPQLFPAGPAALTLAQIAQRAAMYSGAGRAIYFEGADLEAERPGWVVRYEARDDDHTCSPCRDAEGYYFPGDGPYPGEVCLGGGACRCVRISEYDPERYAQLAGI